MTVVRTVLGDIPPAELGVTYSHEHLVIDGGRPVLMEPDFDLSDVDRMATEVAAFQNSRELASFFQVIVTAAPGHTLAEIERVVDDEIAALAATGPTGDELERSLAQAEAQFVYRLQTVGGFGGKSDQLNAYNVFLGEPGYFARDLARYCEASPESIAAYARQCLQTDRRVTLAVVPHGRSELVVPGAERAVVR